MVRLDPPVVGGNEPAAVHRRAGRAGARLDPGRHEPPEDAEYRDDSGRPVPVDVAGAAAARAVEQQPGAARARVLAGYAGWGPGQLDDELAHSAWLMGDVELDLVFDVEPAAMWETAIRRLGADPSALQMSHGVH